MRRAPVLLAFVLLAGCVAPPGPTPVPPDAHPFPVGQFFSGRTAGEGMLDILFQEEKPVRVRSHGRVQPDGTLLVTQRIQEGGKPVRERSWRLRETAPGEFRGTLTEAEGPVRAQVRGPSLHVSYAMDGDLEVEQVLTMLPGGRSARNVMVVRKFGLLPVAALDETIVKLD